MLRSTKPPKCKHCKERTEALNKALHDDCVAPWYASHAKKQQAKAAKVERATTKARRRELETIPELIRAAQKEFNAFVRERDAGKPCICCGKPLGEGDIGGAFDCGHYRSVGSASHLRFTENNAHGQRKVCNRWGAGRAVDYRRGLVERIGVEAVEALESDNTPHKWTRDELRGIRDTYRAKLKALQSTRKEEA